jgi:hypothetical protein
MQADIYMEEPVFLVSNKSVRAPVGGGDPRIYFSLSEYYWPADVSAVNPTGTPYRFNASVNLDVRCLPRRCMHTRVLRARRKRMQPPCATRDPCYARCRCTI